ncbi:alpha-hemoglobin-stabilizing protein-like [Hyaena hyaena]|uniref:alpha-hemoglobin-stabilizing protein-like n=1 Tax=Hyaena hyaena TaxID=95912 RepID=UPI00192335CD|nr:alpha-hemoglobin-stabilizing protein-like [Hyaena hyaena]
MALLQANKYLISTGMKEFNVLLNQQVFPNPSVPEAARMTTVDDWVNFYINCYRKQVTGEQQEEERALQELGQELDTLSALFLAKYMAFLKFL